MITLCVNEECKMKLKCFRHEAKPEELCQSHSLVTLFKPIDDSHCEHFMEIYGESNEQQS